MKKKRVNHKQVSSLEPLPPKLYTVSADGGKWIHPSTGEYCEFALIIDEGSRFRVARVLKKGNHQTMTAAEFLDYLREGWIQYFGKPVTLRLDPAGAFRSHEMEHFCDDQGILLDVIPGEAHWQLGRAERHGAILKHMIDKFHEDHLIGSPHDFEQCLIQLCNAKNALSRHEGFTPEMWVLGKMKPLPGCNTNPYLDSASFLGLDLT